MIVKAMDFEGDTLTLKIERKSFHEAYVLKNKFRPGDYAIKRDDPKRSLSANAYYHVLLGKLAAELHVTRNYMHNTLIRQYGQPMRIDSKIPHVVIPDTEEAESRAIELETVHLKPTSQVKRGKDGKDYRTYMIMRGSHDLTTKEFSALLDGLIESCKMCEIETMTPEQLARLDGYETKK